MSALWKSTSVHTDESLWTYCIWVCGSRGLGGLPCRDYQRGAGTLSLTSHDVQFARIKLLLRGKNKKINESMWCVFWWQKTRLLSIPNTRELRDLNRGVCLGSKWPNIRWVSGLWFHLTWWSRIIWATPPTISCNVMLVRLPPLE